MKTAVTIGKFYGFHKGHQLLLKKITEKAGQLGMKAVCCKIEMSGQELMDRDEEKRYISSAYPEISDIRYIEFTPEFAALSPQDFVKTYLVDELSVGYLAVGSDFRFGKDRAGDTELLKELGAIYDFEVEIVEKLKSDDCIISSSLIKKLLGDGDVEKASFLLGHSFRFEGKVEEGKHLGRTFGYPTINLKVSHKKLLPRYGVYASRVIINRNAEKEEYQGITNIGIRPSMDDGNAPTIECFIYDFSDDIYGDEVTIEPLRFIRPEMRFESIADLTKQIEMDILEAEGFKHSGL